MLHRIKWPCKLTKPALEALLNKASLMDITDASDLNLKLQDSIIYIISGVLTPCMITTGVRTVSGVVLGKGCWFGLTNLDETPAPHFQFEIVEPITIILIPANHCQLTAETYPELYKWLWHVNPDISARWLQGQVIAGESIMIKIVYLLIDIAAHQGSTKIVSFPISLSQFQFSSMTGISRSRLNHVLKELEHNDEISISRGHITIKSFEKLGARLNELDLSYRDPRKLVL